MNIFSIIGELLLHHHKLVIPGFGTFYIQRRSAELNKVTQVLTPPSREVIFDDQKPSDDGVLSGYIRKKFRLQDREVSEAIIQLVSSWEQQLAKDGKAPVTDLGKFKKEASGKVVFMADEAFIKKVNLFDMPRFTIPAGQKAPTAVKPLPEIVKKAESPKQRIKAWIPVTIIIVMIGLASAVYYTGLYNKIKDLNLKGILTKADDKKADSLVFGTRNTDEAERQQALRFEEQEDSVPVKDESTGNVPNEPIDASSGLKYHIIAGSFLVPNNAERLKVKLEQQGLVSVQLVQQHDYFMVSIGSYALKEKANEAMNEIQKNLSQQLWILKI